MEVNSSLLRIQNIEGNLTTTTGGVGRETDGIIVGVRLTLIMSLNIQGVYVPLGIMRALNLVKEAAFNFLIALLASQARMIITMGRVRMHFLLVAARSARQERVLVALRLLQSV